MYVVDCSTDANGWQYCHYVHPNVSTRRGKMDSNESGDVASSADPSSGSQPSQPQIRWMPSPEVSLVAAAASTSPDSDSLGLSDSRSRSRSRSRSNSTGVRTVLSQSKLRRRYLPPFHSHEPQRGLIKGLLMKVVDGNNRASRATRHHEAPALREPEAVVLLQLLAVLWLVLRPLREQQRRIRLLLRLPAAGRRSHAI